jgi:hypothetical protein
MSQRTYYYNAVTNESSWDPPSVANSFFGMETDVDEDLHEAEVQLPPGWHATIDDPTQRIFWYHDDCETTTWEKPDWVPKGWIPTEDQWEEFTADEGSKYYYNARTGTTQWEPPSGPAKVDDRSIGLAGTDRSTRLQRIKSLKRKTENRESIQLIVADIEAARMNQGGMRSDRAGAHEREWSEIRKNQDQKRTQQDNGTAAVGIELRELAQAGDEER